MSLNTTPSGSRIHIGFFGRTNAGKSSLVNAILGQAHAVVSDVKGTTTDPVYKAMELLPLGPVMIIDTPGMDDEGTLGELRIKKAKQVLRKTDIAVLVVDAAIGLTSMEEELLMLMKEQEIPHLLVWNKIDLSHTKRTRENVQNVYTSATEGKGIEELKNTIPSLIRENTKKHQLVGDLIHSLDFVILVVPIDEAAPKDRLILPQQQVIRDVLESGGISVVVKNTEYRQMIESFGRKPDLVITDSQVFEQVSKDTPDEIPLTSFSILMARKKGFLRVAVEGVKMLDEIQDDDKILIVEGCTHHRQCGDIGTVKLPQWICRYTQREPLFDFCSGTDFPEDLSAYRLVIHCGGCVLNDREVLYRMNSAKMQQVPFTNYGIAIAHMNGILARSIEPFAGAY